LQAAEKGLIPGGGKWHEGIPQGLKPIDFIDFIGTTEVVPCYKTSADGVFPQPVQARSLAVLPAGTETRPNDGALLKEMGL
jgi:hypothetical protein